MSVLKLNISTNSKIWITSDTHYGHKNICRGVTDWRLPDGSVPISQTRDYKDLDQMNDDIVNSINNVVGENDILVHLGDWSFGGIQNVAIFRNRLTCKNIYLVLGNHDHHIQRNKENTRQLFTDVFDYLEITFNKNNVILSHYPISSWNGLDKGNIHLHGHSHLPNDKKISIGRRMDIGIDGHPEFRPYDFERECLNILLNKEIKSEFNNNLDHHLDEIVGKIG